MAPATLKMARAALSFISPDDRAVWIRMGMALRHEFGDDAQDTWEEWASASEAFNAAASKASWRSFKDGGKIGIGTLFAEAKARGYVMERSEVTAPPEQLAADRKRRAEKAAKAEADRIARAAAAAKRAQSQWRMVSKTGESPYLARKLVCGESCGYLPDGSIIIPMVRYDMQPAQMVGKQLIAADGAKRYSGGMDKTDAAFRLGELPVDGDMILLGEGYATCLTLRTGSEHKYAVYVAFDADKLLGVARVLRNLFPSSHILICGDDDYLIGDDGKKKADAAAAAVGNASVTIPIFRAARRAAKKDESLPKLTDYNDLHVVESLDEVKAQLAAAILVAATSTPSPPAQVIDSPIPEHVPPRSAKAPTSEASPPPLQMDATLVVGLATVEWALAHCALIQGSTDVWDSLNKLRMKRAAFTDMMGKDGAKTWTSHAERRSISPRNLPKIVRGVAVPNGGTGEDNIVMMLDRYTLLYGTKTVWDADKRTIIGYDAMALARGNDLSSRWIGHPLHKEVDLDKLVFDPTQRVDLDTHINMFEGFPRKPKQDEEKVQLVLDLLYSICSTESNCDQVFDWVLRWLAYPLQHPGAKMQTALLVFGEKQGTGKSLFFEGIIKPIYGSHGATGGQHQLETQYTMWRSQKLFVLFEEVLSRQDKYSYFGLIKHMITGRDTQVSQKFKDDRTEANHLNCVMLSNEFQAVPLEPDDRRFLVINAITMLDPDLLARVVAVLDEGLIEAFYWFLLSYPLGDFNAHTKPLMTASKERIINFGRPDWEAFYLTWAAGELAVPYCSCLSADLYVVYSRFCSKYGFRSTSWTKFAELIGQRLKKDRQWIYTGPHASAKQLLTVFHVPQEPDNTETLSQQCERFRDRADIKWVE